MKRLLAFLLTIPVTMALAQSNHERRYELKPDPNWPLAIDLGSGNYQIVPSESDSIAVVYQESASENQRKVEVQIGSGHGQNYLKIAGPKSNFHAVIEIPRKTDLRVRMTAGDLHVGKVEGNKDIEIRAGSLEFNAIHPQDYSRADFSVRVGDVTAPIFKETKNRTWRSFQTFGPGKYHLHAHVGVGDLKLRTDAI
jgi:hypothetical protein